MTFRATWHWAAVVEVCRLQTVVGGGGFGAIVYRPVHAMVVVVVAVGLFSAVSDFYTTRYDLCCALAAETLVKWIPNGS